MTSDRETAISVIITTYNSKDTIEDCLQALNSQKTQQEFEVIVVDSSTDDTALRIIQHFPNIRLYRFSERKYCGDARNVGVTLARGRILAFTDSDCIPAEDWIEKIGAAHRSSELVIGGAIGNGKPRGITSWASYFCEFSEWMPGQASRPMVDVAGANMSYKKEVFDRFGQFIEQTYCSDTEFHWRLAREGILPAFDADILVMHRSIGETGSFLRHEVFHGRCFGCVRSKAFGFTLSKRLLYAMASPYIIMKLTIQVIRRNINNPIYFKPFVKSLPLTFLGILCWTFGEAIGYLSHRGS